MTLRTLIACSLLAALAVLGCRSGDESVGTRVVLITLDTLRYDRFEPNDGGSSAMPLTRAHAERGLVFERYYTVSPVTQPVHATLFTGLQPWEHGVTRNGIVLPDRYASIVDTFKRNGFETGAVVASFPVTQRFGFARGFDHWIEDFSKNLNQNKKLWEEHWKIESGKFFATGDGVTSRALAQLSAARAKKQFFWFHYFDPHAPYGASSGRDVVRRRDIMQAIPAGDAAVRGQLEKAKALYDADVAFLDRELDRLLQQLAADETHFETHIVVVSDHGESLGEDGSVGHGSRLTEAELRVPAFIISPSVRPGRRHDIAASIDVAPTLLALAGIEMKGESLAGRDLASTTARHSQAFAMRRTFRETGKTEQRLDGEYYPLSGTLFGAVDEAGVIRRGNAQGFSSDSVESDPRIRDAVVAQFRNFQKSYEASERAHVLTPDARRALEALGYIE